MLSFLETEKEIKNLISDKFNLKFYKDKILEVLKDIKQEELFTEIEAVLIKAIKEKN